MFLFYSSPENTSSPRLWRAILSILFFSELAGGQFSLLFSKISLESACTSNYRCCSHAGGQCSRLRLDMANLYTIYRPTSFCPSPHSIPRKSYSLKLGYWICFLVILVAPALLALVLWRHKGPILQVMQSRRICLDRLTLAWYLLGLKNSQDPAANPGCLQDNL